jgi:hypothetical protein
MTDQASYLYDDTPPPEPRPSPGSLTEAVRRLPEDKCLKVRNHSFNSVRVTASRVAQACGYDRRFICQEAEDEPGLILVWRKPPRSKG